MKCYQISGPSGLDALHQADVPEPEIGPFEVLVEMSAWSLNFRDLSMPYGGYVGNDKVKKNPPMVPLSDGVGRVVATGDGVTRFQVGDRVAGIFFQRWLSGELEASQIGSALGGAIDGVLAERVRFHEDGLVTPPAHLDDGQAACLPCAAVTAWQALTLGPLQAGQTVLLLGTGGVSIFALQFVKQFGARALITSSSNDKLARARQLGADETINYRQQPDWEAEVLGYTDGRGVDHVVEVGGAGTLEKSLASCKVSGRVNLIGVLTGQPDQNPSPMMALFKRITVQGIYVGSRDMFTAMNQAISFNRMEPVIDRRFGFDEVPAAYQYLHSGAHFGKVVIEA